MTEVKQGFGAITLRVDRPALVRLGDTALVEDAYLPDHKQAHILDDITGQFAVGNVVPGDIKPEILALNAAAVGKIYLEIENYPFNLFAHGFSF